jgi:hypothetical protein
MTTTLIIALFVLAIILILTLKIGIREMKHTIKHPHSTGSNAGKQPHSSSNLVH